MAGRKLLTPDSRKGYSGKKISIFCEKARTRRMQLGLEQSNVADRTGLKQSRISELEGGKFFNDCDRIIALARALETTPDYLFGFRDEP